MPSMTGPLYIDGQYLANMVPGGRLFLVNTNTASAARNADRPWFNVAQSAGRTVPSTGGITVFDDLQEAIDACVDSRGDRIVIARGYVAVTETLAFNKTGITVMAQDFGGYRPAMGEYTAIVSADTFTDGPAATITAPCTIVGLGFVGRDTGTSFWEGASCLIGGLATAAPYGVHLYQCRLPTWNYGTQFGISIEGSSDCMVEECLFEGVTTDLVAGIYLQGAAQNIKIHRNTFADCDYALELGAFAGGGPYLDFAFNTVLGADSKGVNTNANTAIGNIRKNDFNTATDTGTYDRTVDQLDDQGLQCIGNSYKDDAGPGV